MSSATTSGPTTVGVRQTWIDQARWIAIVLVVMGHAVGQMRSESGLAIVVSNFVYVFHIPVFVILAGWGARRAEAGGKTLAKIWWQLLLPYLIFQVVAFALGWFLEGDDPSWSFTNQTFGLWFLVALAGWRLIGPWFRGIRWAVPLTLLIALLAGLSPHIGSWLSLSRVLFFLPLFVAGPYLVDLVAAWRRRVMLRVGAGIYLFALAVVVFVLGKDFWRSPFLGKSSYEDLGQGNLAGMAVRLGVLVLATVSATAFLLVLPGTPGAPTRAGQWIAEAGRHTMYPYLLHLQVLTLVGLTEWKTWGQPSVTTGLFILGALAVCVLSETRLVRTVFKPLVEPSALLPHRR
ncbi:acyltransferase family protein [Arthrobacter sp. JSM 101049]|uniref:acyltransferase family protein n=1 Tax=Arthrobacter sp. JSM 101049 TaxID=929097 RepID=UPI003569C5D1